MICEVGCCPYRAIGHIDGIPKPWCKGYGWIEPEQVCCYREELDKAKAVIIERFVK